MAESETDFDSAVLVVDDDLAFSALMAEVLRDRGYRVDVAHDYAQAVDRLAHNEYAVAVVDIVMPGGSGVELIRHIRDRSPDTQALIVTGNPTLPSAVEGIRSGVIDYIQKAEIDLDRVSLIVGTAVERRRLLQQNRRLVHGLQESNARLQSLYEATARFASGDHADHVLETLVESARGLLRAERARVVLFERAHDGALVIRHAAGDGASVLEGMRLPEAEGVAAHVALHGEAVVLQSAEGEERFSPRCDDLGTGPGFLCVPLGQGALCGALSAAGRQEPFGESDRLLATSLATQAAGALDIARKNERAANFFTHTCDMLISVLESIDVHLPGHSRASAGLADMVTRRLGLADEERRAIHFGALLHDIGKIRLEPELLSAERLTPEQVLRLRDHPALGVELLKPISVWEEILPLIGTHHERWDGKGYPSGLAGEDIPLGARVIAVAEAFDAMTRDYPGRPARSTEQALGELQACAGSQFDPRIVRLFVAEFRERPPVPPA
jgi:putative nucleotidyltransferase with HDIG domain